MIIRGTKEWEDRERQRMIDGYGLLSFGDLMGASSPRRITTRIYDKFVSLTPQEQALTEVNRSKRAKA